MTERWRRIFARYPTEACLYRQERKCFRVVFNRKFRKRANRLLRIGMHERIEHVSPPGTSGWLTW